MAKISFDTYRRRRPEAARVLVVEHSSSGVVASDINQAFESAGVQRRNPSRQSDLHTGMPAAMSRRYRTVPSHCGARRYATVALGLRSSN